MADMDYMTTSVQNQLEDATASIEATNSDEVLSFYVGKALDECMKLQAIGPISEMNIEHLLMQLAYDCYRVGYIAPQES
jgi:hypothetical protein